MARRRARRDRRLRRAVLEQRGCLPELSQLDRTVLVLRAGVARSHTRSRVRVADLLDLTVRRIHRVERAALRRLDRLAVDGCKTPASGSAPGTGERVLVGLAGAAAGGAVPAAALQASLAGGVASADARSSRESRDQHPKDRSGVKGAKAKSRSIGPLGKLGVPKSQPLKLAIPILILMVVACAVLGFRRWRFNRRMEAYRY